MKRILISALLLCVAAGAFAQNLNPTVEVTNIYAREATGIEKPSQLLQLPDSVFNFNLDVDYSVRSTPYQGAYEFSPYLVQLRPMPRPSQEGLLYVRAGAGYTLHPEATLVWTPWNNGKFRMNVYADHQSYFGNYHNISAQVNSFTADGTTRKGSEMRTAAGVNFLAVWSSGQVSTDLQYKNIGGTTLTGTAAYNNVWQLKARVKSAPGRVLNYEVGTRMAFTSSPLFSEFHTLTDASIGARAKLNDFRVGAEVETVGQQNNFAGLFNIKPHYMLDLSNFHMDLGLIVSFLVRSSESFCPYGGGVIFPDVHVKMDMVPDVIALYANATGGNRLVSYDLLLSRNPFMAGMTGWQTEVSSDRMKVDVGIRGNVSSRFWYDVSAGWKWCVNPWTWGYIPGSQLPTMGYINHLNIVYGQLDAGWRSDRIDLSASVYYGKTFLPNDLTYAQECLFAPAPFKATARLVYHWGERISAGVVVDGRSALNSKSGYAIPGYADLGLVYEGMITRSLGMWVRAGNLLNQSIQYVPFYAQKGPYFTLGVKLIL